MKITPQIVSDIRQALIYGLLIMVIALCIGYIAAGIIDFIEGIKNDSNWDDS